jgi:hypothetical protein
MNNFCKAQASFWQQNFWEIAIRTWSIYLVDKKPIKNIFGVYSQCKSKIFLGGSKWNAMFYAYFQCRNSAYVGGVYVILILRAWQTSHKGQQSLTKLNTK